MIKPQDILCALLIRLRPEAWNYATLAAHTGLSVSQNHASCKRLRESRLLRQDPTTGWMVSAANLTEFLVHGVPYVFPGRIGEPTRGIPTAYAAPFVAEAFANVQATPLVWPTMEGTVKGNALDPLHPCQVHSLSMPGNEPLYRALVCIDFLRIGQSRERTWATTTLTAILAHARD
jgi:hypothetical protein